MNDLDCLFCKIVSGDEPSELVLDLDKFVVVRNKFPVSPIHVLVIDKEHKEKKDTIFGKYKKDNYWDEMMEAVGEAIKNLGLDKTGYKLVNNGAGYNHFEHEHMHLLGGSEDEPGGPT